MGLQVQVVEELIKPLTCGRRLTKLRNKATMDTTVSTAIGGLPVFVFILITANELDSWVDAWMRAPDCAQANGFVNKCFCRIASWAHFVSVPMLKLLVFPLQYTVQFLNRGSILGISCGSIMVGVLVVAIASAVSAVSYLRYRLSTLHFQYSLRPGIRIGEDNYDPASEREGAGSLCISENISANEHSRGIKCNPGLATSKLSHLQAVMSMLKRFVTGEGCKKGANEPFSLRHVQGHVTIAAARVLARVHTMSFVYKCIATALAVSAGVITVQGMLTVSSQLYGQGQTGTKAISVAFVSFALAVVVLIVATTSEALRRQQKREITIGQRFSEIYAKVRNCDRDNNECRRSIREVLGDGDLIFGQEATADEEARYSPKMLAAAAAVAGIVTIVVVVYNMGIFGTTKGIRHLQSRTMRDYASGKDVFKITARGLKDTVIKDNGMLGGATTSEDFAERLRVIQTMIGTEIPVAHVIGWALALTMLSLSISVTGWIELSKTLDSM